MNNRIKKVIDEQVNNLNNLKNDNYYSSMNKIVNEIVNSIKNGGKLLIAGNGGSAADAQHFAAEIVGRFVLERKGYPAIALTTDTSILTAVGNDYGYDTIFSRQIEALGNSGDVFVGISTSGNSKNVVEAIKKAKEQNLVTIGLTGKDGGMMKDLCDICLSFNYSETARVQEHHLMTYHLICEFVESELKQFYEGNCNEK